MEKGKSSSPIIIVLYGPPCAGKSTLARKINLEFNFQILSTDLLREELVSKKKNLYDVDVVQHIYKLLFIEVSKAIESRKSVIVEGMFLTDKFKKKILKFGSQCQIVPVFITSKLSNLEDRLSQRGNDNINSLHNLVPLSVDKLRYFYNKYKPPILNELIIDTTDNDIEKSYNRLKEIMKIEYTIEVLKKSIINDIK